MHTITLPVRINDCDYLGHVNNTIYMEYIFEATAHILPFEVASNMRIAHIAVEHQKPAWFGKMLEVNVAFLSDALANYVIKQDGDIVALAAVEWVNFHEFQEAIKLYKEQQINLPQIKDTKFRVEHLGKPFIWNYRVQSRELTAGGYIKPTSFIQWVDEAVWEALEKQHWSFNKMKQEDCAVFIVNNDLQVYQHPYWFVGGHIKVLSYLQNVRRVRGTWRHEFYNSDSGELIAREFVTGAFATLDGKIREPAPGLIDACLLGEPQP